MRKVMIRAKGWHNFEYNFYFIAEDEVICLTSVSRRFFVSWILSASFALLIISRFSALYAWVTYLFLVGLLFVVVQRRNHAVALLDDERVRMKEKVVKIPWSKISKVLLSGKKLMIAAGETQYSSRIHGRESLEEVRSFLSSTIGSRFVSVDKSEVEHKLRNSKRLGTTGTVLLTLCFLGVAMLVLGFILIFAYTYSFAGPLLALIGFAILGAGTIPFSLGHKIILGPVPKKIALANLLAVEATLSVFVFVFFSGDIGYITTAVILAMGLSNVMPIVFFLRILRSYVFGRQKI